MFAAGLVEEAKAVSESKGYTLLQELGRGSTACCYLVFSPQYRETFVIKSMPRRSHREALECELTALHQLSCPHIIYLYDYAVTPTCLHLFLEHCPGGSLADYVRRNGPLRGKQLYGALKTILVGIAYIHDCQFAHLDLKPANILIDRFGRPKLADFGLSRGFPDGPMTTDQRAGTLAYMAPEILSDEKYDPRKADVWSLGVLAYALTFGEAPFSARDMESLRVLVDIAEVAPPADCDPMFKAAVNSMLRVRPEKRPTVAQLLELPLFARADIADGKFPVNSGGPKTSASPPPSFGSGVRTAPITRGRILAFPLPVIPNGRPGVVRPVLTQPLALVKRSRTPPAMAAKSQSQPRPSQQ
jgi:serine/threonine protein kinase